MAGRVLGVPHHLKFARVVMATVSLVAWLGVVVGAAPATEPSAAAASAPGEDSGCFRPLTDVLWGFLVTLFACTVAVWSNAKCTALEREDKVLFLFFAVFAPVFGLHEYISQSLQSAVLLWRYNKLCRNLSQPTPSRSWCDHLKMLWSWVSPFSKSPGRILFRCHIVVYVRIESALLQEKWLWESLDSVEDESEAMVVGEVADGKTQNGHYERKELSMRGKALFMLAEVVPKYDQLKFLRGNSGLAMIALGVQALGYIYAVVFRVVKDLPVASLEVVGLILNIILLIEISVFSVFNICHRPLVIYINSTLEQKLLEKMVHVEDRVTPRNWMEKQTNIVVYVVCVCLGGVIVYFIVTLFKVSNILVVFPLIIFLVASILYMIDIDHEHNSILWLSLIMLIVAYIWAFLVTIVYWKSQHFNVQAELLNVSQLIPFIG